MDTDLPPVLSAARYVKLTGQENSILAAGTASANAEQAVGIETSAIQQALCAVRHASALIASTSMSRRTRSRLSSEVVREMDQMNLSAKELRAFALLQLEAALFPESADQP